VPIVDSLKAASAYISAGDFIAAYGVKRFHDPFWWVVFLGVLLIAYYTSLGFCFSYKAYCLTKIVSRSHLDKKLFHSDGVFGLSFVGDFSFTTAAMFFSGWLFAPLVIFSAGRVGFWQYFYSTPVILLEVFFITIFLFLIPLYVIHYKILDEKAVRSTGFYTVTNELSTIPRNTISEDHLKKFDFARKLISEVEAIPNWPLRIDTGFEIFSCVDFCSCLGRGYNRNS